MNEPERPASWYVDPTRRHQYRYWNGTAWTDQVADDQVVGTDPPTLPAAADATEPRPAPTITPPVAPAPAAPPAPAPEPPAPMAAAPTATTATTTPAPRLPVPARPPRAKPVFGAIAAAGGITLAIGSFLQAASASARSGPFGVTVEKRYIDGDGPITLIVGIAVVAIAVLLVVRAVPRWLGWVVALLGAVGALVAVADIADVRDSIDQIEAIGGSASIGPALWVCLAGGIVAAIGGVLAAAVSSSDTT